MIDVYKRMEHYYHNCEADEQIGFCSAMKYLSFLLEKYESVNREIENRKLERQVKYQQELINKLQLKVDDLAEDNSVLRKRNEAIMNFDPVNAKMFRNFYDGYIRCETIAWDMPINFWVQGSIEDIQAHFDEACIFASSNKKPKNPQQYVQQQMIHFYRTKGFNVK